MLRRATLEALADDGAHQLVDLRGLVGDKPRGVHRIQSFGLSAVPPAGAHGIIADLGGRSDRAVLLGLEHADHRPRQTPPGGTVLYDAHGKALKFFPDGTEWDAGGKPVTISNAPKVTVKGNAEVVSSAADARFTRVRPHRIDLGVLSPDEEAPYRVMTEGGLSNVVWARVD
ncbi:MAG TPA: phage baseplate assembly protein [Hyphomicrobiales bacterium]|nr:phage baseplate assembly protein [Hyphomicrobiales bacterium]